MSSFALPYFNNKINEKTNKCNRVDISIQRFSTTMDGIYNGHVSGWPVLEQSYFVFLLTFSAWKLDIQLSMHVDQQHSVDSLFSYLWRLTRYVFLSQVDKYTLAISFFPSRSFVFSMFTKVILASDYFDLVLLYEFIMHWIDRLRYSRSHRSNTMFSDKLSIWWKSNCLAGLPSNIQAFPWKCSTSLRLSVYCMLLVVYSGLLHLSSFQLAPICCLWIFRRINNINLRTLFISTL